MSRQLEQEIAKTEQELKAIEDRLRDLKEEKKTEEFRVKITGIKHD